GDHGTGEKHPGGSRFQPSKVLASQSVFVCEPAFRSADRRRRSGESRRDYVRGRRRGAGQPQRLARLVDADGSCRTRLVSGDSASRVQERSSRECIRPTHFFGAASFVEFNDVRQEYLLLAKSALEREKLN